MAHNKKLFEEDSDYDSVATETQESSDEEGDYNVEELLAEKESSEDGLRYYLVNWQGYPDYRMTWEPEQHVASEVLLKQWNETKRLIAQGKAQPFDVDAWEAKKNQWRAERDERARRRKIKLRKRKMRQGLPVSASGSDEDYAGAPPRPDPKTRRGEPKDLDSGDDDVLMGGTSPKKKRVKAPVVKPRKGVAQRSNGSRRKVIGDSDDESENHDSDHSALFEAESQPDLADEHRSPAAEEGSKTSRLPATIASKSNVVGQAEQTAQPVVQRKSGPGLVKTRKPTVNTDKPTAKKSKKQDVLGANPFAPKAPYRQQVLREKPKDPQGAHFKSLGQMGRMNNYGRIEPPPDINQLTFVDMDKGDKLQVQNKPSSIASKPIPRGSREINSAYSRRSPPAGPPWRSTSPPIARPPPADPRRRKTEVCWYWMNGNCDYTEETCNFAHHPVDPAAEIPQFQPHQVQVQDSIQGDWPAQEKTTCFFWQKDGQCKRGGACSFAHVDTGVYSQMWNSLSENEKAEMRDRKARNNRHQQGQAPVKTCLFWQKGVCRFSDEECRFAHYDTRHTSLGGGGQSPGGVSLPLQQMQARMSIGDPGSPVVESVKSPSTTGTPIRSPLTQSDGATSRHLPSLETGTMPVRIRLPAAESGAENNINATFHISGFGHFQTLFYPVDRGVYVIPDRMIMANNFREYCIKSIEQGAAWPAGSIEPIVSSSATERLAEVCKLHVSGLLYVQDRYVVLLYPSNAEEWRYLERSDMPTPQNALLRFRVFPPVDLQPGRLLDVSDVAGLNAAPASNTLNLDLDMDYLFEGVHENPKGQSVFILWPTDRHIELQSLHKRFQHLECKVYTSNVPGAWDYFRKKHNKVSLILVHCDVPLWRVPGLNDFLQSAGGHVHIFRLDTRDTRAVDEDEDEGQIHSQSLERIFPDGRITYITDDVFVYHPQKALAIIYDVLKRGGKGRNAKIATRPGIKDWLYKLALENTTESGRQPTPEYMHLYQAICDLCPPEDEDPYDPPNPLPSSTLISAPADELPSFVGMWERDPAKATSWMVEWFAGWCLMNVEKFRRFVVCHEPQGGGEGDAEKWRKTFQHIGVMRPEQLLEQVRKK